MNTTFLRIGLAFVFLYAGIAALGNPDAWSGFFPLWLTGVAPVSVLNSGFSILEIVLAGWLLLGVFSRLAGIVAAALLLGVVVFNLGALDIAFRDVGLFFAALALARG